MKLRAQLGELDRVDKMTLPMFALTMIAEHLWLRHQAARKEVVHPLPGVPAQLDPLTAPDGLTTPNPLTAPDGLTTPDPLIPVGYERRDTVASLSALFGSIAMGFAWAGVFGKVDRFLLRHRISNLGRRRAALPMAMVLWDFLYYWEHRWMHEVRLLWAHHVTHHSSERYNLSTALRQPWSPFLVHWVFAPMPLLGFPLATTRKAAQLNLLYQYWIHTEAIDRLPKSAELVLNTASHHRVHHGANKEYLDKNYGGILIVWDRLFGSFEPEVRRVKYGLTKNINTYNPLRIAYHEFFDIARDVRTARSMRDRLGYVFRHPGWAPR
jgi:sterol desaturase/sphingolipid hydroxylase (fatty acid hydroxylase superfamily)